MENQTESTPEVQPDLAGAVLGAALLTRLDQLIDLLSPPAVPAPS